jgi:hypothetical protein
MFVALHFDAPATTDATFRERAESALSVLSARPGYRGGRLGRAVDDARTWMLVTEWDGVGAWRRALSSYDVKMGAVPLLTQARDEPSAFEILYVDDGTVGRRHESDRAADADVAGPIP